MLVEVVEGYLSIYTAATLTRKSLIMVWLQFGSTFLKLILWWWYILLGNCLDNSSWWSPHCLISNFIFVGGSSFGCQENAGASGTLYDVVSESLTINNENKRTFTYIYIYIYWIILMLMYKTKLFLSFKNRSNSRWCKWFSNFCCTWWS